MNKLKLSKKKNIPKLKSILASPCPIYWPRINGAEEEALLRLIADDQRREAESPGEYTYNRGLHLGLESCFRLMRKVAASKILLSSELKPNILVNEIINFCVAQDGLIKILLVPNLKDITQKLFKSETLCITLGLKRSKEKFPALETWIESMVEKYPVSQNYLQYFGNIPPTPSSLDEPSTSAAARQYELIKASEYEENVNKASAGQNGPINAVGYKGIYFLKTEGCVLSDSDKVLVKLTEKSPHDMEGDYISFRKNGLKPKVKTFKKDFQFYDYKTDAQNLLQLVKKKITPQKKKYDENLMVIDEDSDSSDDPNSDEFNVGRYIDLQNSKQSERTLRAVARARYGGLRINRVKANPYNVNRNNRA